MLKTIPWALCCVLSQSIWAAEDVVVTIGSGAPKTGALAHLGLDNELGAQLAVNEINAHNNLIIGGQKIKLALLGSDDANDPKIGVRVAQHMVDSGVVAVIGHYDWAVSLATQPIYAAAKVAQVSPTTAHPAYTLKAQRATNGGATAYRVVMSEQEQAKLMGQYAVYAGFKGVAVLNDVSESGRAFGDVLEKTVRAGGLSVLMHEHASKIGDLSQHVRHIRRLNPDVVVWGGTAQSGALLIQQLRAQGVRSTFITSDAACSEDFVALAGVAAEGALCVAGFERVEQLKEGEDFISRFEHAFPKQQRVQRYAPYAYDAVYAVVDAMKKADSTARADVLAHMPQVDIDGVTGRIRFDERGDVLGATATLYQVNNQQLTVSHVLR